MKSKNENFKKSPYNQNKLDMSIYIPKEIRVMIVKYVPVPLHVVLLEVDIFKNLGGCLKLGKSFRTLTLYTAETNNMSLLKWATEKGYHKDSCLYIKAIENENIEMLKYLHENGYPKDPHIREFTAAALVVHKGIPANSSVLKKTEYLKWLTKHQFRYSAKIYNDIASWGNLTLLQAFYKKCSKFDHITMCAHAARAGHIHILKWAKSNGLEINDESGKVATWAAEGGHLEILKWCKESGLKISDEASMEASRSKHIHILNWLSENGYEIHGGCKIIAVEEDATEVAKWLINKGFTFGKEELKNAALRGTIEMLKFILDNNMAQSKRLINYAAMGGQIQTIKFLKDREYPWNKNEIYYIYHENAFIAPEERYATMKYLLELGCPDRPEIDTDFYKSIEDRDAVKLLLDHGCKWDPEICNHLINFEKETIETISWAIDNGAPKNDLNVLVEICISRNRYDIIKYLIEHHNAKFDIINLKSSINAHKRYQTERDWLEENMIKKPKNM